MKVQIYGDRVFSVEVAEGFKDLGHETEIINPRTEEELRRFISDKKPAVFMTLGTPLYYRNNMLSIIGEKPSSDTIYAHWDTDGVLWENLEMNILHISKPDIVFTICPVMQERINKLGIPCHILPFASNPQMHHPVERENEYKGKITFVGNWYHQLAIDKPDHLRQKSMKVLFKPLLENKYEVHFYGANAGGYPFRQVFDSDIPAEYLHGHVLYDQIHKIFSGCFINLIPQNYENSIIKRTFEILSSGGFGLSYDTPAMREIFPEGDGFVYTSSYKETLDIVEYYQKNTEAYERVRKNALETAKHHTYKQRAETFISKMKQGEE